MPAIDGVGKCYGANGHNDGAARTAAMSEVDAATSLRSAAQQRAYHALYGDGGFSSWERVLAAAKSENRASILKNGTKELFKLAARADVNHTEVADWAYDIANAHNIGDDDAIQKIIVEAKRAAELTAPAVPADPHRSKDGSQALTVIGENTWDDPDLDLLEDRRGVLPGFPVNIRHGKITLSGHHTARVSLLPMSLSRS